MNPVDLKELILQLIKAQKSLNSDCMRMSYSLPIAEEPLYRVKVTFEIEEKEFYHDEDGAAEAE